jgi:hypothetical protein
MTAKKTTKKAAKKVARKVPAVKEEPATEPEVVQETMPVIEESVKKDPRGPIDILYPGAPGVDSLYGDKDPDFVRWLHKNHPEDYKARYRKRKTCIDYEAPKGPSLTKQCVTAQIKGGEDFAHRRGYQADEHGYTEGVLLSEYRKGWVQAGGAL